MGNKYDYRQLRQFINANHDRFSELNYDTSLSSTQKMNSLVEWFKVMLKEYNDWVDYLDDFKEKFDNQLFETTDDVLKEWVKSGLFDELLNQGKIVDINNEIDKIKVELNDKTSIDYVNTIISSIAQGSPRELFYSIKALKDKYPNGAQGTYLVFDSSLTDGAHSFMWDINSSEWVDLGAYQGVKIGKKSVNESMTTFIKQMTFSRNDLTSIFGFFTGSSPIIADSPNQTNASIYVKIEDIKELKIDALYIPKFLYLGSTVNEPKVGETVKNIVTIADGTNIYDDSKEYVYTIPNDCKYLIIRCWNTDDQLSLDQIKGNFTIRNNNALDYNFELNNDILVNIGNENIEDSSINIEKINGLEQALSKTLSKSDAREYKIKYVTIENKLDFNRYDYIQLKVNFEQGECRNPSCLRVFKNGVELPFQFDDVEEENFSKYTKRTYYPDGSLNAGTLWIKDTVNTNTSNLYELRVYSNDQEYSFANQIQVLDGENQFNVIDGSNNYEFEKKSFNLQRINNKVFTDDSRSKINGETIRLKTFDVLNTQISSNGLIFKDVTRLLKYSNDLMCLQNYRIFLGGRLEVSLKSIVLRDTPSGYIESIYSGFNTIGGDVIVSENGEYYYTMRNDTATYGISPIYTNGNVQRDSTTLPVYPTKIYTSFRSDQNTLLVGWDYFGVKTYPIAKDVFFSNKYIVDLEANTNTKISQYFPLVAYTTDKTISKTKEDIINLLSDHVNHLKDYALSKSNLDYFNLSLPYIKFYEYKFIGNTTIDDVISSFNQTYNVKFSGETKETFKTDYQNGLGVHISGRFIQIAYIIYKELNKISDNRADRFKNITINYGLFLSDVWVEKNDVPMVYPNGTTNNGRATALSCMAQALVLSDNETMQTSYDGLSNLISQATRVNSILPDGNLSTSRYLHYSAFAMYELSKASLLKNTTIANLKSYTNNITDNIHPTGEVKDMTYCCSDSRRGLGHTYTYSALTLILKGNYGEVSLALTTLKWLVSQDLPFGTQAFPLDGYAYNNSQKYDGALPFELISLIEFLIQATN